MSEILTLHVGGCGYSLANNFWSNLCREHKIDHEGRYYGTYDAELECISSYFHETLQDNESKKMTLETFTQSLITDPKLNSLLTFASSAKLQMKKVTSPIKNTTLFNNIFEDGPSVSCDLTKGNFINAMSIIRGNIDCTNFEEKLLEKFDQIKYPYKTQIKNSIKIERFQITRQKNKPSCLIATNHTSIINSYNKISTFFSRLLYRRAFTHYYTDEGMELDDFAESLELVKEYSNNYSIYNEILNQQKLKELK